MFSCEYFEIFKNTFFIEHLRWLLLNMKKWSKKWRVKWKKLILFRYIVDFALVHDLVLPSFFLILIIFVL